MRQIRWILLIVAAVYGIVLVSGLGIFDHAPGPSNAFAYEYSTTITTSTSTSTSFTTSTTTSTPPACLYTMGFYKNHPGVVTDAVNSVGGLELDGRTLNASEVNAVIGSTPSKHTGVTFTSNSLLTLAQQVLAAEVNIARGAVAPASVTQALQQANAGLIVSPTGTIQISTSLTSKQISSLTSTLASFNEARLGGTRCQS
jgi:hypothetical protein